MGSRSPRHPGYEALRSATRRSIHVRGFSASYLEWGREHDADRLTVQLHGVHSSAATTARISAAIAAAGGHVVAFDLPGHGETRELAPRSGGNVTERASEMVADGLHALGAKATTLIGHSWGATVALGAMTRGVGANRVILVEPVNQTAAEAMETGEQLAAEVTDRLDVALERVRAWGSRDELDVFTKAEALTQASASTIRAIFRDPAAFDVIARLTALSKDRAATIRVVVGLGEDSYVSAPELDRYQRLLGSDRVFTVAKGGHWPQWDAFDRYLALLRRLA